MSRTDSYSSLEGERIRIGDTTGVITETRDGPTTKLEVTAEIGGIMQELTVSHQYAIENHVGDENRGAE